MKREENNPTRNSKVCLSETNIIPSSEDVLQKRMSFVCNTSVELC
jgi:hypothetical protein